MFQTLSATSSPCWLLDWGAPQSSWRGAPREPHEVRCRTCGARFSVKHIKHCHHVTHYLNIHTSTMNSLPFSASLTVYQSSRGHMFVSEIFIHGGKPINSKLFGVSDVQTKGSANELWFLNYANRMCHTFLNDWIKFLSSYVSNFLFS